MGIRFDIPNTLPELDLFPTPEQRRDALKEVRRRLHADNFAQWLVVVLLILNIVFFTVYEFAKRTGILAMLGGRDDLLLFSILPISMTLSD